MAPSIGTSEETDETEKNPQALNTVDIFELKSETNTFFHNAPHFKVLIRSPGIVHFLERCFIHGGKT